MKKIIVILGIALLALSCAAFNMTSTVKKLEPGMGENQVVGMMGTSYSVVFADSFVRVLMYTNPLSGTRYRLTFTGGRLSSIETNPIDHPHH